jgi:RNA polymerase sigma-70 factor (ECF subfamily)
MEDRGIVGLFLERSEQAIGKLAEKYGRLCHQIAGNILSSAHDAEECVNDAYLALWNSIPPEKPQFLRAYLLKVLRNIAYDRLDKRNAMQRRSNMTVCMQELEDCLPSESEAGFELPAPLHRQGDTSKAECLRWPLSGVPDQQIQAVPLCLNDNFHRNRDNCGF